MDKTTGDAERSLGPIRARPMEPEQFVAGVLARFEFSPDSAAEAPAFFDAGLSIVQAQPESTVWLAFRLGPNTFGAFAAFATEADRDALLEAGGPKIALEQRGLFADAPTFEKVSIIASRVIGQPRS